MPAAAGLRPLRAVFLLVLLAMAGLLTGCEITDPDWQARQNDPNAALSSIPPPSQQWAPPFEHETRQERDFGFP